MALHERCAATASSAQLPTRALPLVSATPPTPGTRRRLAALCLAAVCVGSLATACSGIASPTTIDSDALAVVAEMDRLARRDLWPGFDASTIPLAIYDGERTLLFRHPAPPAGFQPLAGATAVWAYPGRLASVTANSSVEIGGVSTATLMPAAGSVSLQQRAGVLIHEAFHVHQSQHYPSWQANEVELFTYPFDQPELLALRRMEAEALRRALTADDVPYSACWARVALDLRRARFDRMAPGAVGYERGIERYEGLAHYVESRATEVADSAVMPSADFAADAIRQRGYATGNAIARLLDRFWSSWRSLRDHDSTALDTLLAQALAATDTGRTACALTASQRRRFEASAAADVEDLHGRLAAQRDAFLQQPGWTVVVDATAHPLFPHGFDPLNVQRGQRGEVLHTRWLRLGNGAGTIEVLGHAALSEAAGEHPLFNGLHRLTIAGLADEPSVAQADDVVTVQNGALRAELRAATVQRSGQTITVRLADAK
jgi:hypothetical protein